MHTSKKIFLGLPLFFLCCLSGKAQADADQKRQALKQLIDARNFAFNAQSATSNKGRTIQLSPGYGLTIGNDSIQVDLPYYGRAYATTYPPDNNMGIQFGSRNYTYQSDTSKKGEWEITIKPKDETVSVIYLSVSSTGYCTVRVNSKDRDPIAYYGTVADHRDR